MKESLIVFTRYPEAGKTKTRIIPALGAEGAANLHRQMTEYTLLQARQPSIDRPFAIEIHFTGGNARLMEDWLGSGLVYRQQSRGDLGQRMKSAFEIAFARGKSKAIVIGTDCPSLTPALIFAAFDALDRGSDLVLGPALDGGYYLIGLCGSFPELFTGIEWGSSRVFEQTRAIARQLNLRVCELAALRDIDRPEDLIAVPWLDRTIEPKA